MASQRNRNWGIAAGVLAVVAVGAWVGNAAGNLAHRAPRGSGMRVAILSESPLLQDAIARDLEGLEGISVIPPLVVTSKRLAMVRGGIEDATDADAADVLDAHVVHDAAAQLDVTAALAGARARVGNASPARAPITANADAYASFLRGQSAAEGGGDFVNAIGHYEAAIALDEGFAEAYAALAWAHFSMVERDDAATARAKDAIRMARVHSARLSPVSSLIIDALDAWFAHDDAPPALREALREPAIAACRALTVKFPEERNGHLLLGRAYRELFDGATEALRHLEAARRLTPEYLPVTQQLVIAWLDIGDRSHAQQALRGFLQTSPGHVEAKRLLDGLSIPAQQR